MISGQLRHRVRIQSPVYADDGQGGKTLSSWSSLGYAWASIEPTSAKEQFFAQHLEHRITHRVTVRYRSDITADCRLIARGRTLSIRGLRNLDERDRELQILCEETEEE